MPVPLHPFSEMLTKLRRKGGGGYDNLSERQQWQFHADVYAFRHIVLDVPANIRTSPCDPEGKYYDENLVLLAVNYYHEKFVRNREQHRKARGDDLQREGRDIVTKWVQSQGFVSVDDYCERHGGDVLTAHRDYLKSPEFKAVAKARDGGACG